VLLPEFVTGIVFFSSLAGMNDCAGEPEPLPAWQYFTIEDSFQRRSKPEHFTGIYGEYMARNRAVSFAADTIIQDAEQQIREADKELEQAKREPDPNKRNWAIAEAQAKINRASSRLSDARHMKSQ
jgi:hypothetical protein